MIKERLPNYTQVCVIPGFIVDEDKIQEFTDQFEEIFDTRVQYLETITTKPDLDDPENTGGRLDVFFAVHQDDIAKFAVRRLQYGIRWIEDVLSNANEYHLNPIYPEYVEGYKSWDADSNDGNDENEDDDDKWWDHNDDNDEDDC